MRQLRPRFFRRQRSDARQQRLHAGLHGAFIEPLAIQEFLSVSTDSRQMSMICALGRRSRRAGDPPDLRTVSDARDALQSNLRRRPFTCVGAEQAMDLLRPGVGFQ